jgi:hypothetical protein
MKKRLLVDDLYRFLVSLQEILQRRGVSSLAENIQFASRFAFGSTTEFYTEAEKALKSVLAEQRNSLDEAEIIKVNQILQGIDIEFKRIGGA